MLTKNFGVTNKEHYGMLWYFLEWSIFTLSWWALAFLILSPPLQNFPVVLPRKECLLCFLSLALIRCRPFSRWASLACRPLSLFLPLSFSCSIFQICGHDNLSKFNNLDNTDTETISAFRFRALLTLLLSLLYKTPVVMRFPAKITSSCIWVTIPVDWVILHWYACGADRWYLGRAGGVRSRDYQIFSDG